MLNFGGVQEDRASFGGSWRTSPPSGIHMWKGSNLTLRNDGMKTIDQKTANKSVIEFLSKKNMAKTNLVKQ